VLEVPINSRDKNLRMLPSTKLISIITGSEFAVPNTTKLLY
jgi:hypothetical protein